MLSPPTQNATLRRSLAGLGLALLTLSAAAPATSRGQDAKQELQAIEKEIQQEFKLLRAATKEAANDEAASALWRDYYETILPEFAARYAAVADAHAGTALALEAWMKVVGLVEQGVKGPFGDRALAALLRDHLESEDLDDLAGMLRYAAPSVGEDKVAGALRTLSERSPHRPVQAAALFSLGAVLGEDRPAGDPKIAEAKAVFARLAAFGDLKSPDGRTYAEAAKAFVFALENLALGMRCPDFAAVDAEGAAFKLSDYAGKVVLIDFWGFW